MLFLISSRRYRTQPLSKGGYIVVEQGTFDCVRTVTTVMHAVGISPQPT